VAAPASPASAPRASPAALSKFVFEEKRKAMPEMLWDGTLSHLLAAPGLPVLEKILRPVIVYVALVVLLRVFGKRELAQLNPFDLVVLLSLSNTVQNAIIGDDNSLLGGIIGAGMLLLVNWAVVRFYYEHPRLHRLIEGDPDILIREGRVLTQNLKRQMITYSELEAAARRQGIEGLDKVDTCRLETGGALTFVPKRPTEEENRQRALLEQFNALAATQREILQRLDALDARGAPSS
jgi:uncharacterized membrane protein YcaP (DUF421 family)